MPPNNRRGRRAAILTDALSRTADPVAIADRVRLLTREPGRDRAAKELPDRMVVAICRGEHSVVQARLPARLVLADQYGGDLVLLLASSDAVGAALELAEVARRTVILA